MKIKRNINGQMVEFELTREEICQVFQEQEKENHKDDIQSVLEEKEIFVSDEQFEMAVCLYKKYLSNDDSWRYAAEEAISVARYSK